MKGRTVDVLLVLVFFPPLIVTFCTQFAMSFSYLKKKKCVHKLDQKGVIHVCKTRSFLSDEAYGLGLESNSEA